MNNNCIIVNDLNERFSYSYSVFDEKYITCYIAIKDINFRFKKDIKDYLKNGYKLHDLEKFVKTLNKNYELVLIKTYQHFKLYELKKLRVYNKKIDTIKFDLKQFDSVNDIVDDKFSDLN